MYSAPNSNVNIGKTIWQLKILTITCLKHAPQDCCQCYKDAIAVAVKITHWKINKARNTNTWEIVGNKLYAGALQWETVTEGFPKVIVVSRRVYQDCLCIHPCMTWWFYPSHAFGEGSPFTISTNRQICVHPPCHTPIISLFTHHFSYILWLIKDTKIWLYKNIHFP